MLKGKKILIGITGSIAAYKIPLLIRLFIKEGADVRVILTPDANNFVTPLTLSVLTGNPVLSGSFNKDNGVWNSHVELGLWADVLIIAPATANTMAKMVNGIADNLLLTTYLSAKCPVFFAPAMDLDMFKHHTTVKNLDILQQYGNILIQPADGPLASGLCGEGRMEEPEVIFKRIKQHFEKPCLLIDKKILITAGPTYEKIDPVRFIGNYSSGLMGFALAEYAADMGAEVFLISGPTSLRTQKKGIFRIDVTSAAEMLKACMNLQNRADIIIMSAAVADYKPENVHTQKIKKHENVFEIRLTKTSDILSELSKSKMPHQIIAGFALETENELENAVTKLKNKNLDIIVLNSLNDKDAGFGKSSNKISIIDRSGKITHFDTKPKKEVASDIINYIIVNFLDKKI